MQKNEFPERPAYLVESADAALRIVLLVQRRGEVRVRDIAADFGVAPSTAHRLLQTLVWRDFLTQDRIGKAYRAGPVMMEIASTRTLESSMREVSRAHVERLAREVDETVTVMIREASSARFVFAVESTQPLRVAARPGTMLPATALAGGKVLLAWMAEEDRRAILPARLPKLTATATSSYDQLVVELAEVRRRGYAVNINGSSDGLCAIGVPIHAAGGEIIASVAVSLPSARWTPHTPMRLLPSLLQCAAAIDADIAAR